MMRKNLVGEPHEYVRCQECGQIFKVVEHSHLVARHNMTIEEYERKYPNHPRVSTITLLRLGRRREVSERLEELVNATLYNYTKRL